MCIKRKGFPVLKEPALYFVEWANIDICIIANVLIVLFIPEETVDHAQL